MLVFAILVPVSALVGLGALIKDKFGSKARKIIDFLDKKLIWNGILRYSITAYLKFALIAVGISKQHTVGRLLSEASGGKSEGFYSLLQIAAVAAIILFPFFTLGCLQENIAKLEEKQVRRRYGSTYLGLKIEPVALCYTTVFCYRRGAISLLILLRTECPGLRIPLFLVTQLVYMAFLL